MINQVLENDWVNQLFVWFLVYGTSIWWWAFQFVTIVIKRKDTVTLQSKYLYWKFVAEVKYNANMQSLDKVTIIEKNFNVKKW